MLEGGGREDWDESQKRKEGEPNRGALVGDQKMVVYQRSSFGVYLRPCWCWARLLTAPGNACCPFSDKFDCLRKGVSAGLILCLFRGKRRERVCVVLRATYKKEEKTSCLSPISIVSLFYSHFPNSGSGMENGTSSGDRLGEGSNCKLWSSWRYHHIFVIVLLWSLFQRWWVAYWESLRQVRKLKMLIMIFKNIYYGEKECHISYFI